MAFRLQPAGPPQAYRTFQIRAPRTPAHERPATCEEVDCEAYRYGWVTRVPAASEFEHAVRKARSGRPWTSEHRDAAEVVFTYAPGTPCFQAASHRITAGVEQPQLFVVRGGDWRGNPTGERRVHARPEDWVEDLQESTAVAIDQHEKG